MVTPPMRAVDVSALFQARWGGGGDGKGEGKGAVRGRVKDGGKGDGWQRHPSKLGGWESIRKTISSLAGPIQCYTATTVTYGPAAGFPAVQFIHSYVQSIYSHYTVHSQLCTVNSQPLYS